jgi:hypothetical protein
MLQSSVLCGGATRSGLRTCHTPAIKHLSSLLWTKHFPVRMHFQAMQFVSGYSESSAELVESWPRDDTAPMKASSNLTQTSPPMTPSIEKPHRCVCQISAPRGRAGLHALLWVKWWRERGGLKIDVELRTSRCRWSDISRDPISSRDRSVP